ncbi:MAG: 1-acyl-sn-glycerol-3-phosphate acyltransferase [Bacteroidota bacterium]
MRKNYLWYQFWRYGIIRPALHLFYSDVTVAGQHHIPDEKPVLFIGNHQNSFLDALHVVNNTRHFVHFLTRAEAFGNPVLDKFFESLNMLPVYRARDGFRTISRNRDIFKDCFKRLHQNDAVLVFAEASHALERRVRPLSKGFTRIAFGAEASYNWQLDLQIIPVGINYGDHCKSQTPVRIIFDEAMPLAEYRKHYQEDERAAAQKLKADVARRLKKLTLHIPSKSDYPLYRLLLDELEPNRNVLLSPNLINQRAQKIKDQLNGEHVGDAKALLVKMDDLNINLKKVVHPPKPTGKDLLLSPAYLFSLLNNFIPYQAVRWLVNSYLEDEAFEASVKFLVGLSLPFYYLLISIILLMAGLGWPVAAGYFVGSLATAPLFVRGKDLAESMFFGKKKRSKLLDSNDFEERLTKFKDLRVSLFSHPDKNNNED